MKVKLKNDGMDAPTIVEIVRLGEETFAEQVAKIPFSVRAETDANTAGLQSRYMITTLNSEGVFRSLSQMSDDLINIGEYQTEVSIAPMRAAGYLQYDRQFKFGKATARDASLRLGIAAGRSIKQLVWETIDQYPIFKSSIVLTGTPLEIYNSFIAAIDAYLMVHGVNPDKFFMGVDTYNILNRAIINVEFNESVLDRLKKDYAQLEFTQVPELNAYVSDSNPNARKRMFIVENSPDRITFSLEIPFSTIEADGVEGGIYKTTIAGSYASLGTIPKVPKSVLQLEEV